jgi:signal peptidase II
MNKTSLKAFFLNFTIILIIFLIDRISKFYILKLAEVESSVDIYVTSYLNLFLIWNKGIAFGLLSMNESMIYNTITLMIGFIIIFILFMMWKNDNIQS